MCELDSNHMAGSALKITIIFFMGARVFIARHAKLKVAKIKGLYAVQRDLAYGSAEKNQGNSFSC